MQRNALRRSWLALAVCALAGLLAGCEDSLELSSPPDKGTIEYSLAQAIETEGGVECTPYVSEDFQSCIVEIDPGSGWGGKLHLKIDGKGCWRARYVRYNRKLDFATPQPDLSFGSYEARHRTIRGCADLES